MIWFNEVTKSFGTKTVLNKLSLHIPKGKVTFIIGKSGEGKSVTIKHIMRLMNPDEGRIIVDGQDISDLEGREVLRYRYKFGFLFQHAALFDSMTIGENVSFPLQEQTDMSPNAILIQTEHALEKVGLPNCQHRPVGELSTGEKKRVGLARAIVAEPKILLYDEPTTGMDPIVCEMIDELIVKINHDQEHLTSVVISHDLKAAMSTADQIIFLYKGRVRAFGSPADFRGTTDPIIKQFFSGRINGPMELL